MPDTRIVEDGGFSSLYDGPCSQMFGPDDVGTTWPRGQGHGEWIVMVHRRFATRDEALKVLEFVAALREGKDGR